MDYDSIKQWLGTVAVAIFGLGAGKALIVNWFQKSTELAAARADSKTIEHHSRRLTELETKNSDLTQQLIHAAKTEGELRGQIAAKDGTIEAHERTMQFLSQENAKLSLRVTELEMALEEVRAMIGRRKTDD